MMCEASVEKWLKIIQAPDRFERVSALFEAIQTLGEAGEARAIAPLLELLDPDGLPPDHRAGSPESYFGIVLVTSTALVEIGEPAVEPLLAFLPLARPRLAAWVVMTLGGIGDNRAVPPLLEYLQRW